MVAQVALSLVLVFAAGLFMRTFAGLTGKDLGLERDAILLVGLDAQRSAAKPGERPWLYDRVREAATEVPGVARAAVSVVAPVSGMGWNDRFEIEGAGQELSDHDRLAWANAVTPAFFATYGTPVLAGRDFDPSDRTGAPLVAIVNQAFARRFGGSGSVLGRVLLRDGPPGGKPSPFEIVGMVGDAVYRRPRDPMEPTVYLALAQLPAEDTWPFATLSVRSGAGSPALLAKEVGSAIGKTDPNLSLTFRLFSDQIGAAVMRERIVALLSAFFGGLALFLAGIGLYGVTSYAVTRRRTEIGVRMALGAEASGVVRLVLGKTLRLVALGLVVGTAASLWASRFVGSLLFGLEPGDLPTLAAAAATLLGIALLAAGLPARRAARIDPAQVLREG